MDSHNIVKMKTSVCHLVAIKEFPWPQEQPRPQGSLLAVEHLFATPHSPANIKLRRIFIQDMPLPKNAN